MGTGHHLTREAIVDALVESLEPLDFVHALWEGGAVSFDRVDEWSDLDLYVAVDDDRVEEAFRAVEDSLRGLSGIRQKFDVGKTQWPGISQAFYRLEGTSEYLLIDLAVVQMSSEEKLLQPEIHGAAEFRFNKSGKVKAPEFDRGSFDSRMRARCARLRSRMEMFGIFVQKEINRGNDIEAVDLYNGLVLGSLVEVLRMRHGPLHYDFRTHYVHHELPPQVVSRLNDLFYVRDIADLQQKYLDALDWFWETADVLSSGDPDGVVP